MRVIVVLLLVAACGDDGGAALDAARPADAAVDAASAVLDATAPDAAAPDAGRPDAGAGIVDCKGTVCERDVEECCVAVIEFPPDFQCVTVDTCAQSVFACDGPEDCPLPEQECCIHAASGIPPSACTAPDICFGILLCHVDADCPTDEVCCDETFAPGKACREAKDCN